MLSCSATGSIAWQARVTLETEFEIGEVIAERKLTLRRAPAIWRYASLLEDRIPVRTPTSSTAFTALTWMEERSPHGCGVTGFNPVKPMQRIGIDFP
jgi:hypothetical protein